jgi:hypothetical protein
MNFLQHILAVYAALRLVESAGAEAAVSRASWHLALANNAVAWGWGHSEEQDRANELNRLFLRAARGRLTRVAEERQVYEAYQNHVTLNNHWRLAASAPACAGLPSYNIHWGAGK